MVSHFGPMMQLTEIACFLKGTNLLLTNKLILLTLNTGSESTQQLPTLSR